MSIDRREFMKFTALSGLGLALDRHADAQDAPVKALASQARPITHIPSEFGVRLEDIMVITENGAELLTGQAPSLERPFG